MRMTLALLVALTMTITSFAFAQSIANSKVTVTAVSSGAKVLGFTIQPNGSDLQATILFGSNGNLWAMQVAAPKASGRSALVFAPLMSDPTPQLGSGSFVSVTLLPDDPYPVIAFKLALESFNRAAWEARFGTVPFHFLCMSMPGAEMFYHRGWQIPTPNVDPYPMQGKQTGYGKQIRSDWSDNWTYAPPLGAQPMPDVGLWWPSKRLFACYDFHQARLTTNDEKDIATAYVWQQGKLSQFVTLAWPYAGGYRETLRYPQKLPQTIGTHFHFLWALDAGPDRDPNLIVQEFVWARYSDLLPEVPKVNDLGWLPDSDRPNAWMPPNVGLGYGRLEKDDWFKAGALTFGGVGWDRPAVQYAHDAGDAASMANVKDTIEFMTPRVTWLDIDGDRCATWREALEGDGIDIFDGGAASVHNAQTWQMGLLYLQAYRSDPDAYAKYLDVIDGLLRWSKHFLYTRNDYFDVPAAQFCWTAAPVAAYCLQYYETFRTDPARRDLADLALRLARNDTYHFLPTWMEDSNQMDDLDSFSFCEPNAGISWLGSACSNEVWCVPYAATVTYLATGDPWLGHYVRGAVERWHELFRDEWYPTVRQYDQTLSEEYYLYPGRGPLGQRVTFGGISGELEQIAWPAGEATVRITCGEKAALAWDRPAGVPPIKVDRSAVTRLAPPDVKRGGEHTDFADYRYYGDGQCSFRLVKLGYGQAEPFAVDVTFPYFDLRGKPVLLLRDGQTTPLVKGRDYDEVAYRWDTVVVRGCRYGDVIGVGKVDDSVPVLPCEISRVRGQRPAIAVPKPYQIADIRPVANTELSFDWEDPGSWAGLEFGRRFIFGVPFDVVDPSLNAGKVAARNKSIPLSLTGKHLFVLVGDCGRAAKLTATIAGKPVPIDLNRAVPVLVGWPSCFTWHVDMAEVPMTGPCTALTASSCTVFAATSYAPASADPRLQATLDAMKSKQEAVAAAHRASGELARLAPLFEKMAGHIAILPAPKANPRSSALGNLLQQAGLLKDVVFLEPGDLVDPTYFNPQHFWIAVYAGGENYYQSVLRQGDGDEALRAFLKGGGTLLVLPSGPFPFYYNETDKAVVSAPKFGLPIGGSGYDGRPDTLQGEINGWEKTPAGGRFTFTLDPKQDVLTTVPKTFPFPRSTADVPADERWRPVADAVGAGNVYTPILTLHDAAGKYYGDGAALIEYRRGPLSPGRVVYVWSTLLSRPDLQNKILGDLFRWVLTNAVAPPAQGMACFTHKPITIDGKLDEAAWRGAQTFPLQKVILPTAGANQPTVARVLWDKDNLYVGFQCTDSDVWSTYTTRDRHLWEEEVVEVFVDPTGTGHNYYEFEVNPLNTQVDLKIPAPGQGKIEDALAWNSPGWKSAVTVDGTVASRTDTDRGWTCEMAIPLRDISPTGAAPAVGDQWRVNLYRIDRPSKQFPKNDQLAQFSAWSAVQKGYHEPRHFGTLTFAADPSDDDFSLYPDGGKPLAPWQIVAGSWLIRDHHLVGTDAETNGWTAVGLRGGLPDWRDYRLTVDFEAESIGNDWRDGPWFGVRCVGDSGYFIEFTGRSVQIHKAQNGLTSTDAVNLGDWPFHLAPGPHTVTIDVQGSDEATIAVAIDGSQIGVAHDKDVLGIPPLQAGGIVLAPRKWQTSVGHTAIRYDHVKVDYLPE